MLLQAWFVMQMLSVAVAALAAVSSVSARSAPVNCGWMHEACCNIAPNNPNIGLCLEERSVCWEGVCGMCGPLGKIACPGVCPLLYLY